MRNLDDFVNGAELAHKESYNGNRIGGVMTIGVVRSTELNDGYFNARAEPTYFSEQCGPITKRIQIDKTTHRVRFENETESEVVIVIEPKEGV